MAALSKAGLRPTNIKIVEPTKKELNRLLDEPINSNLKIPGEKIAITPGKNDLEVLEIIETPKDS
ncbi:hypothetical protein [Hahella chejuensis]|uniref:hypothetical protein n=1 Tax=Hahella chejuensis TaxID=158327 RepID=UPI0011D03BDA|nr:hypothetical protein [Hahella chejuensis]